MSLALSNLCAFRRDKEVFYNFLKSKLFQRCLGQSAYLCDAFSRY